MSDHSPTMSVPELAERLGTDPSTAYRYLRDGKLPGVHIGSKWLIDRQRVERFMAGLEDAAGRPLLHALPATDAPALTLPERTPDTRESALLWLHGAQAALEFLVGAVVMEDLSPRMSDEHTERRRSGA